MEPFYRFSLIHITEKKFYSNMKSDDCTDIMKLVMAGEEEKLMDMIKETFYKRKELWKCVLRRV